MNNLCIIPARGNSKRIPRKNIKSFLGKPIIAFSIEAALKSECFDRVIVSTDDNEIASVSKEYGAEVPFLRSAKNSDDFSTLADVIDEVKMQFDKLGKKFDFICCILPTAPLIRIQNIRQGKEILENNKSFDSVRPITEYSFPIQRSFRLMGNRVKLNFPNYKDSRSQDLEKSFHDAGQFYWMKYSSGMRGKIKGGFPINNINVQDIDTQDDWKIAELKYKIMKENQLL